VGVDAVVLGMRRRRRIRGVRVRVSMVGDVGLVVVEQYVSR
jgi:hypothetical protein